MSILKLEPGDKVNLSIKQVSTVEGKFGPQYLLTGTTPDDGDATLYLNVKTADQQFSRMGLSALTAEGQTFEIERIEKNGTKYTNINRPSGAVPAPRAAAPVKQGYTSGPRIDAIDGPRPIATPEYVDEVGQQKAVDALTDPTAKLDRLFALYGVCYAQAHATIKRTFPGEAPSQVAVCAATATLFIAAKDRGLAA